MERKLLKSKHWWRMLLLLFICLLGGSSPTWAGVSFEPNCYIESQPSVGSPYIDINMCYYDEKGNDSYFTHKESWVPKDAVTGNASDAGNYIDVDGPAIYVDGHYIGSADDELAWPGGSNNGNDDGAYKYTNNDSWVGNTYEKTYNGVTYRVRFYDPFENPTDRYRIHMRVYISQMEIGKTHTVYIHGYWKINNDKTYEINHTMTTNAVSCPWSGSPTAAMTNYNTVSVSGPLANNYATTVGIYKTTSGNAPSGYVAKSDANLHYKDIGQGNSTFNNLTGTHTRDNQYNSSMVPIEYIVSRTDNSFTTYFYKWYNVSVPGFVKPTNLSAEPNQWTKSIKLTWSKETSSNRSQEGTWTIKRDNKVIADKLAYSTSSFTDVKTDNNDGPAYETKYTYKVYFVPKDSPTGTYPNELMAEKTDDQKTQINRNWNISLNGELVNGGKNIKLTWNHNAIGNASGSKTYQLILYRLDLSESNSEWKEIKTVTINSSSITGDNHTDNDELIGNHTYTYMVKINLLEQDYVASVEGIRLDGSTLLSFEATRGTYSNLVKLSWTVNQVGVNETSFILYRRPLGSKSDKDWSQIYTTSGTGSNYSYDDNTVLIGTFNEYKVAITGMEHNKLMTYSSLTTDGFTFSTGIVGGRITYGTGTAVDGVKVKLKQQNSDGDLSTAAMHSLKLSDSGAGMAYNTDTTEVKELFENDFSVQMWVKPLESGMGENNKDYLAFDVVNMFTVRLWYDSSKKAYQVGGWISGNERTNIYIPADEWSHLTFSHSHNDAQTIVYVATGDTIMKDTILIGQKVPWTGVANCLAVGNSGNFSSNNIQGFIDEFRFFTKALTEKEFLRNYNHPLAGNEDGLAIYYPFDEGVESQTIAYDYSKTNGIANGRHAVTKVAAFSSNDLPNEDQLSMMAYTDTLGNYTIRGVYFQGEGTAYSVIPELGIHEFSPSAQSRFVSQSSLIHSGVDFEDVSSFPVSGKIFYENTTYPVEGVNFYVDGTICAKDGEVIATNAEGEFTISVPIGDHFIRVEKNGHKFVHNGRYPEDPNNTGEKITFNQEIKNLTFFDKTLVNFTGRVVGGSIEGDKPVGFSLSKNNIGVTELVLTPLNDKYNMNNVREVKGTVVTDSVNAATLPVASATTAINSTSWRGATIDNCKNIYIRTDFATGEFSAMLPPLQYKISPMKVVKTGLEVGASTTVDLSNPLIEYSDTLHNEDGTDELYTYNTILKQVYHSTPTFIVTQQGHDDGAFGLDSYKLEDEEGELTINDIYTFDSNGKPAYKYKGAVFEMSERYYFDIEAFEEYVNRDDATPVTDHVPLSDLVVTIENALSNQQPVYIEDGIVDSEQVKAGDVANLQSNQLQLDSLGKATYVWTAGLPNISKPYTRTISMSYKIEDREYLWSESGMQGVILGSMPTGNNFVTSGPDMLDMILRDPPGTGSSAEWSSGTVINKSSSDVGTWNSETHLTTTTKLGVDFSTISGSLPGVAVVNNADSKSDLEVGIKINIEGEAGDTWSRTVETTKTISTSSDPDYVGDQGDVFIGTATNVIFGKARNVGFHRIGNSNEADLNLDDVITTGLSFSTEFSYTQKYIENVLIPNLKALRNSLLQTVSSIEGHKNTGQLPIYLTTLSPDDENFGEPNKNNIKNGKVIPSSEGPSYTMVLPEGIDADFQDSIIWCNNQIETWKKHLAFNEEEKVKAFELRNDKDSVKYVNYSFDAGASVTYSTDSTEVNGSKYDMQFALGVHLNRAWGVEVKKNGVIFDVGTETSAGYHREHEESTEEKASFNYTLAEEGSDALTVDVYQYGAYGPIFRTRGGQTSNPYEGKVVTKYYEPGSTIMDATMQIEVPQIDVDVNTVSDIPTGSAANYTLRLGNASEIGEDVAYKLFVLDETNPDGAQISIDGKVLTEGRLIKVPGNQTLTKALQLRQTDTSILEYEGVLVGNHDLYKRGIGIVFASESQPEEIADTVFIKAFFVPSSSAVDLALSNTTINTQTGTDLNLTFSGFDRNYNGLKAFRLQYKKQGSADWTLLKEYVLNEANKTANNEMLPATGASVTYKLPMKSFSDGNYTFRCVSASTYGTEEVYKYSEEIALVKDMQRPTPLGLPEPSDGIFSAGDDISITFNEDILRGELTKEGNFLVTGILNGAAIEHGTALSMQNTDMTATTEAIINLANKDFSIDTWINFQGAGTILSHGSGASKMTIGTNADNKLVVTLGGNTYVSTNVVPMNKWSFLTLNYQKNETGGHLSASVASDADVDSLFSYRAVAAYEGVGPLSVGRQMKGAIHELLLWDEAHDLTTALMNRSKTKSPSTRHLIGYWKMNEGEGKKITDYARNRHMTMPDETWYLNNENKAISLDGDHYAAINTSILNIFEGDDYALEFWVRGNKQTGEAQLLQMGDVALWTDSEGKLQLTGKAAFNDSEGIVLATNSSSLTDNTWHHVALNVLRQGAAAVYVDGARVLTTNAANVGSITTDKLLMGARRTTIVSGENYSYDRVFNGQIDEVRVWGATLTADKLKNNRKVRLTGKEDGLVAYYPFETKTLNDFSQVVTLGSDSCFTGSSTKAQLLTLNSQLSTLNYTDEAPALRAKPTETNVSFTYVASDTKVVITIDEDPATIEGCTLNFTVRDVRDENGNYSLPAIWSAFVNQNRLVWNTDELVVEQPANTSSTVTATIQNNGGTMQSWTLNGIPAWIRASVTSGDTNPLSETKVTFTVTESTPIGKYEETIYLTGTDGIETPLTIRVTVKGKEPDWAVNEKDFEGSMILIGTLEILGVPSEDSDDIVAAFVDGECRGVARPEYKQRYDHYLITMGIYGNNDELNKDVTFKAYDASTGVTYPVIVTSEDVNFLVDEMYGKPANPVILSAVDIQEQFTALAKGWNWLSLNVTLDEMTVPVVFKDISASTALVKNKNISMMNYDGTWYGQSIGLNNSEMYKVQMSQADNLHIMGKKVDPQATPITLVAGWNWVAYNGLQTISITDAMADMDPRDGDVVKGQRGTAMYDGYEWYGNLTSLVPGQGYMIKTTDARTFRYPKAVSAAGARMMNSYDEAPSHFAPVGCHLYPSNMTVVAQVLVNGVPAAGIEVGVFDKEECRAAAVTDADGLAVLTIPGDGHATMTFRVYDGSLTAACNETLPYENDAIQGSRRSPFIVSVSPTGIETLTQQDSDSMLYDLQGRRVYRQAEGVQRSTLKKGIYIEDGQKRVKK